MKRCIYYSEIIGDISDCGFVDRLSEDFFQEEFISFPPDYFYSPVSNRLIEIAGLVSVEYINLLHLLSYFRSFLRRELGPVRPVDLIAVVFLRIVGGCDIKACRGMIVQYGKAELRSRSQGIKESYPDTVCVR